MFTDKYITKENLKILTRFFIKGVEITAGTGSPEGSVSAVVGSLYLNKTAAGGQIWEKRSGSGNTGWGLVGDSGYSGDAVHITSDFDLTTPPTESFNLYDTNTADFIGSPDDSKSWNIQRTKASDHTVAVEIAIERSSGGDMYTRVYAIGAWSAWKKINILDPNGNLIIDNTKKVGNGTANSNNSIQFGNGATIYNVPTGQQHIFRQDGATVAGIDGNGKIYVEGTGKGIILKSPDGTRYEVTVPNGGGSLTITAL